MRTSLSWFINAVGVVFGVLHALAVHLVSRFIAE